MDLNVDKLTQHSTLIKGATLIVALIWVLVVLLGALFLQKTSQAQLPAPTPVAPTIQLVPTTGSAGSSVTVQSEGWPSGKEVIIYLMDSSVPSYAVVSVVADPMGRFRVNFLIPSDLRWQNSGTVIVLAQAADHSLSAQASLSLFSAISTVTPSPLVTPPPVPTDTLASRPLRLHRGR